MLIIDSNHLRVLRIPGSKSNRLKTKLIADGRDVVTTIINVHEGIKGYFHEINEAKNGSAKIAPYANLQSLLEYYANWIVLPFDEVAAKRFDDLKRIPILRRIGAWDLQIAAIALCHGATVLTQNIKDFKDIPELKVEDWLIEAPSDEPP